MKSLVVLFSLVVSQGALAQENLGKIESGFVLQEMDDSEMDGYSAQFATPEELRKNVDMNTSVMSQDLSTMDSISNSNVQPTVVIPQGISHTRLNNNLIP